MKIIQSIKTLKNLIHVVDSLDMRLEMRFNKEEHNIDYKYDEFNNYKPWENFSKFYDKVEEEERTSETLHPNKIKKIRQVYNQELNIDLQEPLESRKFDSFLKRPFRNELTLEYNRNKNKHKIIIISKHTSYEHDVIDYRIFLKVQVIADYFLKDNENVKNYHNFLTYNIDLYDDPLYIHIEFEAEQSIRTQLKFILDKFNSIIKDFKIYRELYDYEYKYEKFLKEMQLRGWRTTKRKKKQ